ncbi:hypothetical protein [Priestia megaterium]|uniref:Uncharacterized protein n=1 Tax=Priestia megaterium TaxID=1404 RepID=A0A6M6E5I0_PRIMG|nr:hypothetical protein [Priestia megaterium]QJX80389.1 hypothetical protein FDZ14_30345 [Priestia megaterium]
MFKDKKNLTNKKYVIDLLSRCKEWQVGDFEEFTYKHWDLTLIKEEPKYAPYAFALQGVNTIGTGTWGRRYYDANKAILHALNRFNENANIKDQYNTIEEFLISK